MTDEEIIKKQMEAARPDFENMPTPEELKKAEVESYLLNARENYPEPFYMLEYKGVPFSTLGGIQALSGQKKNGKTFVLAQLMAAILGTGTPRTRQYLPGLQVPLRTMGYLREKYGNDEYQPSVLYVDTEMEKLNSAKVLRRVHWLCNWEMDVPNDRFHVLWLRGVTDVKDGDKVIEKAFQKRYRLIKDAITMLNPDAVFIDGIRDIIGDFNDNEESAQLVGELMALAEQRQIYIWNTLHMNPRPGNDEESKMRGHLGTELGNKITDTLVSIKHKDSATGNVDFTVKQNDARGKDLEDWTFEVTDAAGALGIPRILGTADITDEEERVRRKTDEYFSAFPWTNSGATYTELEKHLKSKGIRSNRQISEMFNTAMEAGIIYKSDKKKYHYKGLGKPILNDKVEEIPFDGTTTDDVPF